MNLVVSALRCFTDKGNGFSDSITVHPDVPDGPAILVLPEVLLRFSIENIMGSDIKWKYENGGHNEAKCVERQQNEGI